MNRKLPSMLGQSSAGGDVAKVGTAVGTAALKTAPAVSSLLQAAGVSAVAAPPWSWVVTGGIAAAAGTVALVGAVRRGKMRRAQAIEAAEQLGLPDAAEVPGFIVGLLKASPDRRRRLGVKLDTELRKLERRWKQRGGLSKPAQRKLRKLQTKLRLIGTVETYEAAAERQTVAPSLPPQQLQQEYGATAIDSWIPWVVGGVVLAGGVALLVMR